MAISVIVFDFDGTLIDSNQIKYNAYFKLFPKDEFHSRIINKVLENNLEESRYVILEKVLEMLGKAEDIQKNVAALADKYNNIVVSKIKDCKEKPYTSKVLNTLSSKFHIYLSSTTPEESLKEVVKHKRWGHFFVGIFGYPRNKVDTLLSIIDKEGVNPDEILVVGDGESDRISASTVGCKFFYAGKNRLNKMLDGNFFDH